MVTCIKRRSGAFSHGNVVNFILTWAWLVKVLSTKIGFHTKAELGNFSAFFAIILRRVTEIKIASNVVFIRSWGVSVLNESGTLAGTKLN